MDSGVQWFCEINRRIMMGMYYLRDTRSNTGSNASFWAKKGGYTTNLNDAELFTEEKALRQHNSRESDLPVAVDFVAGKTRQRVDCQYVDISPTLRDGDKHVVIFSGRWDGNDVQFIANEGRTYNFEDAAVFELEEACELASTHPYYLIKPYDDMAEITRATVDAIHVQPEACAQFSGFTLKAPPKPSKPIYRCYSCGVFMSQFQFYASNCQKCGLPNQ